jgi:hypothetical protein
MRLRALKPRALGQVSSELTRHATLADLNTREKCLKPAGWPQLRRTVPGGVLVENPRPRQDPTFQERTMRSALKGKGGKEEAYMVGEWK